MTTSATARTRAAAAPGDALTRRRSRGTWARVGAGVLAAVCATVVAADLSRDDVQPAPPAPQPREAAVLVPPHLVAAGTLPDRPVQSVEDFAVPFTFRTPPDPATWGYRAFLQFEIGDMVSGMTLLAPAETYDPTRTWRGQTELVPAPVDAAGWARWLEETGLVEISQRRELLIGGAPATRFTLAVDDLPDSHEGCGGLRTCVALMPMKDYGPATPTAGAGPQAGIEEETAEMTVIELEGRAVVALATGKPDRREDWLPTLRAVIDSLRFA